MGIKKNEALPEEPQAKKEQKKDKKKDSAQRELNFTHLNTNLIEIWHEIYALSEVRQPQPIRTPPHKRNMSKYCEFHQDHDHHTEDCITLHMEIKKLIKSGKLAKFVVGQRQQAL